MSTTKIFIDLSQFCSADTSTRYSFSEPFVLAKWKYATDGRICVRVPTDEPTSGRVINDAATVFNHPEVDRQPWPDAPLLVRDDECVFCKGRGRIGTKPCDPCGESGEIQCSQCGHVITCSACDGHGYYGGTTCSDCKGKSSGIFPVCRQVGDLYVRADYDRKIRDLPGLRWDGNDKEKVYFSFDGGEGVVMNYKYVTAAV